MNKRGKSWHLIVTALLIVVFSFTALFGVSYTYGDTKNVYIKGAEDIRFGIDIRGGVDSFHELLEVIDRLREGGTVCRLLYLEADTQSIIKRYKETRRAHPMGSDTMLKLLGLSQMQDAAAGLTFHGTGKLITPLGAKVLRSSAVPAGTIIGLDKHYALEMVKAGDVSVEYDKLIDRQLERAAITTISGFAKLFQGAARVLEL